MRAWFVVLLALAVSGCFGGSQTLNVSESQSVQRHENWHVFEGSLAAGAAMPLGGPAPQSASTQETFNVAAGLHTATLEFSANGVAVATIRDGDGNLVCAPRTGRQCSFVSNATQDAAWTATITSLERNGIDYELSVRITDDPPVYGHDPTPAAQWRVDPAGVRGGEPTLAVLDDGRALVVAGGGVVRWNGPGDYSDVTPPLDDAAGITLDPFLVGDPVTGRVYVSQLAACQRLSWTDDGGDSWTTNPLACGGPDQHHQKLAVGPGPAGGRAVHMMTMNLGSWLVTDDTLLTHAASFDDGYSWLQTPALTPADSIEARAIGNVATSETGDVHAIAYLCDGFVEADYHGVAAGRSTDYGATWTWQVIGPGGGRCEGIDPGIFAVGDAVHAVWWDAAPGTWTLQYSTSADGGVTWTEPAPIPTPGLGSFVFADVAASPTAVAAAFLATPDTTLGPTQAPSWARWYPYAATLELGDEDADWNLVRLEDHPVQVGQICMDGPQCVDGARNLLDFIDIQLDAEDGAYVAYPDGCGAECVRNYESRGAELRLAIQRGG